MVIAKSQREDMRKCEENEMCNECVECSASVCLMSCEKEIDFYNKYSKLINELETKAAKWDMIESAIENEVMFVDTHNDSINGHQTLTTEDMEYLEKMHKEREQSE